jgi:hypothetical protein
MQNIGKIFVAIGGLISAFFPQWAAEGAALVTIGEGLLAGTGTVGPVRIGSEGITVTVAPWTGA